MRRKEAEHLGKEAIYLQKCDPIIYHDGLNPYSADTTQFKIFQKSYDRWWNVYYYCESLFDDLGGRGIKK